MLSDKIVDYCQTFLSGLVVIRLLLKVSPSWVDNFVGSLQNVQSDRDVGQSLMPSWWIRGATLRLGCRCSSVVNSVFPSASFFFSSFYFTVSHFEDNR